MPVARSSSAMRWRSFLGEIGGLALIWLGEIARLEKIALPLCCLLVSMDAIRRHRSRLGFDRLWMIFNGSALGFGLMAWGLRDRLTPDLFGALFAALIAMVFLVGSSWRVTLIQRLAEQRQNGAFEGENPLRDSFFRLYTRVWAGYFAARALMLVWMSGQPQDLTMMQIILKGSLLGMILLSFRGAALYRLYAICRGEKAVPVQGAG